MSFQYWQRQEAASKEGVPVVSICCRSSTFYGLICPFDKESPLRRRRRTIWIGKEYAWPAFQGRKKLDNYKDIISFQESDMTTPRSGLFLWPSPRAPLHRLSLLSRFGRGSVRSWPRLQRRPLRGKSPTPRKRQKKDSFYGSHNIEFHKQVP